MKSGGLHKYCEGYDNQPMAWIDDPVMPEGMSASECGQELKNVLSTGAARVEDSGTISGDG